MPDSKPAPRRQIMLSADDTLLRLVMLPEREQEQVLHTFTAAIVAAEARVIAREAILYTAAHRQAIETHLAA